MLKKKHLIGLVGVGFLASAVPAMAQVTAGSRNFTCMWVKRSATN